MYLFIVTIGLIFQSVQCNSVLTGDATRQSEVFFKVEERNVADSREPFSSEHADVLHNNNIITKNLGYSDRKAINRTATAEYPSTIIVKHVDASRIRRMKDFTKNERNNDRKAMTTTTATAEYPSTKVVKHIGASRIWRMNKDSKCPSNYCKSSTGICWPCYIMSNHLDWTTDVASNNEYKPLADGAHPHRVKRSIIPPVKCPLGNYKISENGPCLPCPKPKKKNDDDLEPAIPPPYLLRLRPRQLQLTTTTSIPAECL